MSRRKQDSVGFIQNAQEHTVNACLCTSLKQHLEVSLKCSSTKAWEDGEKGNWGLPKITQLHNYLQKELGEKKKKGGDDKISRDEEIWVGEDCLGIYPIIVEESP